jgi:hypothetical protein
MDKLLRIINGGIVYLRKGNYQDYTEINFNGRLEVLDSASIDSVKINNGGQCCIKSGGRAGFIEVRKNGVLAVKKGAQVGWILALPNSNVTIEKGAIVDHLIDHSGSVTLEDGCIVKSHIYPELC